MKTAPLTKKIFAVLGIAIVLAGVFWIFAHPVFAADIESTKGQGLVGAGLGWVTGVTAQPALLIWYILLYIAQLVLTWILSAVSFFLNNIFYYAIVLNPSNMPVVVEGWVIVRNIVNGFFILIVLWIALTIIFDLEQYGGKKLLFRVFVTALLMNFSLALVSVTFGFANQLSLPFYNKITQANHGDLAGLIIDRTKIQTIFKAVSKNQDVGAENVKLGIDKKTGCGFQALAPTLGAGKGCISSDSLAGEFALSYTSEFLKGADILGLLSLTVSLAISLALLAAVIAAMIGISALLLVRIIYMVFLGILAPAAFVAHIIPGGKMEGIWNTWLKKLFCWAFIAPAFYFLFYMSLRILVVMTETDIVTMTKNLGILGNLLNTIPFIVFLGFLYASIKVGKWMGCTALGEVGVEWSKKLLKAGVVGTAQATGAIISGGTSLVAGRVAGTVAGAAKGLMTKPGAGRIIAGIAQRAANKNIIEDKTKIGTAKKDAENFSPDNIAATIRGTSNANKIIGNAQALLDKNSFKKLSLQEQRNIVSLAERVGAENDFLIANPALTLNIPAGQKITSNTDLKDLDVFIAKMKPKEKANIDYAAVAQGRDDTEADILYQRMFKTATKTGGVRDMEEMAKSILEIPKEPRKKVLNAWNTVMNNNNHWKEIQQDEPVMYNNYIRFIAGKAGGKIFDKGELPKWMREEAMRLGAGGSKKGGGEGGQPKREPSPLEIPPSGFGGGRRGEPEPSRPPLFQPPIPPANPPAPPQPPPPTPPTPPSKP